VSLVRELKRRNVVRVAIFYTVASWLILQLADVFGSLLDLPDWTGRLVVLLLALGLPVALVISWVYEITPEGLARTSDVDRNRSITPQTGRRLDRLIMSGLGLAILVLLVDRYLPRERPDTRPAAHSPQPGAGAALPSRSIAVLPFVNMSNDPGNEYFSDGISEEILNTLAHVDGLHVAARTSSFRFKGQAADVADIGRQLKVGTVLEGSVRKEGNSVRITAQLIDVTNGYHLWSSTFDRTLENVFAVQTEIAGQIVEALQSRMRDPEAGAQPVELRPLPTRNAQAYELFLQGRHLWRQRNAAALASAIGMLEQAVKLDPRFAEAYAALASAYYVTQNYASVDVQATYARAREAAEQAQALDSSLAEPVAVKAAILADQEQWAAAQRGLQHAIELEPDQATPHHWLALQYYYTGRLRDFSTEIDRAYALDPTNAAIISLVGVARQLAGDLPAAVRSFELAASMGGIFAAVSRLPHAYYAAGQPEKALEAARRGYPRIGVDPRLADVIYAAARDPARRERARQAILSAPRNDYSALQRIGDLVIVGAYETAIEQALTAPDATPADLLVNAWSKSARPLRRSPEFMEFTRRVGLFEHWRETGWPDLCRPRGDSFECD
jgi:TolB-like protein